jgi:hypothetical protein
MPLFRRTSQEPIAALPAGPWSVRDCQYEGRPMILRLNAGIAEHAGHRRFPVRAGIAVQFNRPDERGYPSQEEMARLDGFEEEFVERFCGDDTTLAAVITTGGMREFLFYCHSEQAFRERFREWARTPKSHRIQMVIARDRSWDVYRTLAATH